MNDGEVPSLNPEPFAQNPAIEPSRELTSYAPVPCRASVSVGRWLGRTQSQVKSRLQLAYRRSQKSTNSAMANLRQQAQRIREERPLPALAVISGSAFALGVTLAVLRSRRT
jgi:hypothetical protein